MRKAALLLIVFIFPIASIFLSSNTLYAVPSSMVQVDQIDHTITPYYGGLVTINDTVTISPIAQSTTVDSFIIGFPSKYETNLRFSMAYDGTNSSKELDMVLDTGLGVIGYYGVSIVFPNEIREVLYNGQSYTFTIIFSFSDLIISSSGNMYALNFPTYPSLIQNASICNVKVTLPINSKYVSSDVSFNSTLRNSRYHLNYTKTALSLLSSDSGMVIFKPDSVEYFACFSVNRLYREVFVAADGRVSVSEQYLVKSKTAYDVSSVKLLLPTTAENISASDEQGKKINTAPQPDEANTFKIFFSLEINQSTSFKVNYFLRKETHLEQQSVYSFKLNLRLSENLQVIPSTFIMKVVFPEGSVLQSFPEQKFSIQKDVFQDTLSLSLSNITWMQDEQWSFTYDYTIFWTAFRPTLWVTTLVIIGAVIAFAWSRPKAAVPVSIVLVPRKTLKDFVDTYEEKKKIVSEIEQTKRQAQKGKISRRRYKVKRTTLENRLSVISKRLMELRQNVMSGGAKYADIIRQLEVAETELDNIEADIQRIEVRFKRGEISAQTYRQLLEDDLKRKEKAQVTIDGALLRLRE